MEGYLSNSPFAYRTGGSCINALLKMQHTNLTALDKRDTLAIRMFTVDFSKAFDNVSYGLLVEKRKRSPISPFMINWYASILADKRHPPS